MPDIRLPEATLIDIKRISKDYQKKWQARINYSELFDIAKKEKQYNAHQKHKKDKAGAASSVEP